MEPYINTKSNKKMIIDILLENFPLSVKDIHRVINKRYNSKTNYFTIYDSVRSLIKQGILIKIGRKYSINSRWIREMEEFVNKLMVKYPVFEEKKLLKNIDKSESVKLLTFDSLSNFYDFITEYRNNFISNAKKGKDNTICFLGDHVWGPILYMKQRSETIRNMKEKGIKYYLLICGKEPLDKFALTVYKDLGINTVKSGLKKQMNTMTVIYNDVLLYLIHPFEMLKEIDNLFMSTKDVKNANVISLFEKYSIKKMKYYAIIIKNKSFVEQQKKFIISHFK
jgi:hypothetical protein